MAPRNLTQLTYQAIRIEGGLIPSDELARLTTLQAPEQTQQKDAQYGVPKGLKLRDEIARFWKIAQNLWSEFQSLRQRQDVDAHRATVQEFLVPLLRDVLGYVELASGAKVQTSGHTYNIGYAARAGRLPVILAAHTQALDVSAERFGELNPDTGKTRRRSPFMLAQEALNASDASLWAITSNGLVLRILRDNPSLTRPAYVEIDLEAIFSEDLYADFTAFWLLAHASRFGKADTEPADCVWEHWRAAGQEAGVTIRSNLRYQVAEALRALGTGFLSHPRNTHLREQLQKQEQAGSLGKQAFFEELLGLVYRLIFLSTVEDRTDPGTGQPLIFTPGALPEVRQRYLSGYSLTWLRERAVRRSSFDTHSDLWQALSITFDALANGQDALGLPALGGLFDGDQCPHLASAHIENRWLLAAVFQLGYFRQASSLTRVNYRDMGPEELGSVYESLLELVPDIQSLGQTHAAKLAFVGDEDSDASTKGNTRKLTGSYYTPDSLVQELIKSALEPVIAQTVKDYPERPVDALLQLTVCDPACGSGHFLLAAARRLADEVAKLRAVQSHAQASADTATGPLGEQQAYRHALRDVVSHCIYGVDKNPMAIALAKTALWLEAYTPDRPLTFLDHHLQVGDALLGVLDPKILESGIPDEAFAVLSGDDKATASALKKQNKADLKSWKEVAANDLFQTSGLAAHANEVERLADDSLEGIAAKRSAWTRTSAEAQHSTLARLADTYVAAFLAPKVPEGSACIPLSGYLWGLLHPAQSQMAKANVAEAAYKLCRTHTVFHWWLAFPQVAAKGGFSVMLGNPPWERIKLQEEEFFANRSPLVAMAKNKAERAKRIEFLRQGILLHTVYPEVEAAEGLHPPNQAEMRLYDEFMAARRGAEAASLFAHNSRRYPLMGVGDVNTYALFAETFLSLVSPRGRAGFICPTGVATDDSTKMYFASLVASERLVSLLSFDEIRRWFPATDDRKPFCLFTIGRSASARFIYDIGTWADLAKPEKWYELTKTDFERLNPNTLTLPIFRSQRDAELTKRLYGAAPVLIEEAHKDSAGKERPEANPWGIRFLRMFDMSTDSNLFSDESSWPGESRRLPLYEGKMIHQFDHRWSTYIDAPGKPDGLDTEDSTGEQKADAFYAVRPRYWVEDRQVLARIARVPSRLAASWLATHAVGAYALPETEKSLEFGVASWLAGELFRRAVGEPDRDDGWSDKILGGVFQAVSNELELRFEPLASTLRGVGIEGKKALKEFMYWAKLDAEVPLGEREFTDIAEWLNCWHRLSSEGTRVQALLNMVDAWMDARSPRWLMGWRDISRNTDERSVIASVVPRTGVGHTMPLFFAAQAPPLQAALFANWCSLVLDYAARQKVGGTHLTYGYLKQFPLLPPTQYSEKDLAFIVPRVLELTFTAHELRYWAEDLGYTGAPFPWNPVRRAGLRAELDAYYAKLYGIERDDLRFILDPADVVGQHYPSETFRVLKNNEIREFGAYRTRQLVLAAWDSLTAGTMSQQPAYVDAFPPVYSEQGAIRNAQDAEYAGLIAALIRRSTAGISVSVLQDVIAYLPTAATYLDSADSVRLNLLAGTVDALGSNLNSALKSIAPVVQRLESSGAVVKKRASDTNLYFAGSKALPADVSSKPEHEELAQLMLLVAGRRALASGMEAGGDGRERATGG